MLTHSIINLLGIKDKHVEIFDAGEEQGMFWFELHTRVKTQKCPHCKSHTKRVHSYRMQKIQSSTVAGKRVYLHVKKRRYRCTTCGHTFYEKLSFVDRYQRHTLMLAQEAFVLSAEMSFTHAGMLTGVSTNQLLRMFDNRSIPVKKVLPRAIAIDEFKGDAGRKNTKR